MAEADLIVFAKNGTKKADCTSLHKLGKFVHNKPVKNNRTFETITFHSSILYLATFLSIMHVKRLNTGALNPVEICGLLIMVAA
ncbi:MAG: hypothetical protein AB8B80_02765 [Marinicellaceae bacterium]